MADLSARTRIRAEYLSALEKEQLSGLPERALLRSFVQTYAREVGLDPLPLLADLDRQLPALVPAGLGALAGVIGAADLADRARSTAASPT